MVFNRTENRYTQPQTFTMSAGRAQKPTQKCIMTVLLYTNRV